MKAWWQKLSGRDQNILLAGGVIVGLLLFWALVFDPIQNSRRSLRSQVVAAENNLAFMQQAAQQLAQLQSTRNTSVFDRKGESLLALVYSSAHEAQLGNTIKSVEPISSNRVNVWLEAADFDAVALWLEQLQSRFGIRVEEYSIQQGEGVGKVTARIILLDNL